VSSGTVVVGFTCKNSPDLAAYNVHALMDTVACACRKQTAASCRIRTLCLLAPYLPDRETSVPVHRRGEIA
jgi:hypothetical protein